jgi:hypothetical protein
MCLFGTRGAEEIRINCLMGHVFGEFNDLHGKTDSEIRAIVQKEWEESEAGRNRGTIELVNNVSGDREHVINNSQLDNQTLTSFLMGKLPVRRVGVVAPKVDVTADVKFLGGSMPQKRQVGSDTQRLIDYLMTGA